MAIFKFKIPPKIQDQLSKLPESGMGYQKATLVFENNGNSKRENVTIINGEYFETDRNMDVAKLKKIIIQK